MAQTMIQKYIHSKVSDPFDLDVDTVANKCKGYGRFRYWLGSNVTRVKEVLNAVKDAGVSPAYFASYEAGEGYNGSWGWLNHTTPQGNPVQDARAVCSWLKRQSQDMSGQPAWIDYANYVDFVPGSVKAEGNKDFASLPSGTIGRVTIAGTAAATWEVYYPKGLLASYNGVQNYGKPLTDQYKKILDWGGKIDGKGSDGDDEDTGGSDGGSSGGNNSGNSISAIKKAFEKFLDSLEDAMTWDMHSVGAEKFFSNSFFAMQKTFNNTYRLQMNTKLIDNMRDLIDGIDTGSNGENTGDTDDKDDKPSEEHKSVPPNGKNGSLIGGSWTYENIPKKYRDKIGVPRFDTSYLNKPGNIFPSTGNKGQCTELTWAYMWQIWGKRQPADDGQITNGQRVWEVYKKQGAKTTHSPTVGYGFSSKPPYIQASLPGVGHTGVVVAVFDDGSFLTANYNIWPNLAPSRVLLYSLINGVPKDGGHNFMFFSGIA